MERASLTVGEINADVPRTYGDTFVHVSEFGSTPDGTWIHHIGVAGRPIARLEDGFAHFLVSDHLGSPILITSYEGSVLERLRTALRTVEAWSARVPSVAGALEDLASAEIHASEATMKARAGSSPA